MWQGAVRSLFTHLSPSFQSCYIPYCFWPLGLTSELALKPTPPQQTHLEIWTPGWPTCCHWLCPALLFGCYDSVPLPARPVPRSPCHTQLLALLPFKGSLSALLPDSLTVLACKLVVAWVFFLVIIFYLIKLLINCFCVLSTTYADVNSNLVNFIKSIHI